MKVSIALATFNGAKFLKEQLDSLVAQERQPDEMVVCDDSSTDETMDILSRFSVTAPFPVRIYRNTINIGYVKNFERAMTMCSGTHIFLCDQDDVWMPTKIGRVLKEFEADPKVCVVVNDQIIVDEILQGVGRTKLQNLRSIGQSDLNMHTGCCMALTRAWRDYCLPFPANVKGHDIWISRLAITLGVRRYIEDGLQLYRRHGNNVTSWIVSSDQKATFTRMAVSGGLRDASVGWARQLLLVQNLIAHLEARHETVDLCNDVDLRAVVLDLQNNRAAIERRIAAVKLHRSRRIVSIIRNLFEGDYRYFMGWKSFIKDCLR